MYKGHKTTAIYCSLFHVYVVLVENTVIVIKYRADYSYFISGLTCPDPKNCLHCIYMCPCLGAEHSG